MVSCQEPPPLKDNKHSLQCHPHVAALVNAHSCVSMGMEARCCPCHSAAHCWHMKRQPSLCHCCPPCGRCHCNPHRCLCCCCCFCLRCHRHYPRPLPLKLPSNFATVVSVVLLSAIAIAIALAVGHCRLHHHWPLQLPSLWVTTVAVAIGHF